MFRVTMGHLRVTIGHLRVIMGDLNLELSPHWDGLREAESNHSYMLPSCLALPARAQSCTCFGGRK